MPEADRSVERMMVTRVCRRYHFAASHQLNGLPADHPCSRLHGHNWTIEIIVEGEVNEVGMVIDFREIDHHLRPLIDGTLDHRHLNDLIDQPTSENVALWLVKNIPIPVASVRVSESESSWAEVTP